MKTWKQLSLKTKAAILVGAPLVGILLAEKTPDEAKPDARPAAIETAATVQEAPTTAPPTEEPTAEPPTEEPTAEPQLIIAEPTEPPPPPTDAGPPTEPPAPRPDLLPGDPRDCKDFNSQGEAQAWWNYWHARGEANPGRLDGKDNDGNVCESWR